MIHRTIGNMRLPAIGLGTLRLQGPDGIAAIRAALDLGYRHVDTAAKYENETEVGQALRESGIPRRDIFVTTKVWHSDLARGDATASAEASLRRLGLDHVDLLLVHWPNAAVPLAETLDAFVKLKERGLTRLIGVSNFNIALLKEALDVIGAPIVGNQVEYHPFVDQAPLTAFMRARNLVLTAYIPFARGAVNADPTLKRIAAAKGKTPSQVTLRWLLQQDNVATIPRSARREHLRENLDVFDFTLTPEEMAAIDGLRRPEHVINPAFAPAWDRL